MPPTYFLCKINSRNTPKLKATHPYSRKDLLAVTLGLASLILFRLSENINCMEISFAPFPFSFASTG